MRLEQAFAVVPEAVVPAGIERFRQHIDPVLVEEALAATEPQLCVGDGFLRSECFGW